MAKSRTETWIALILLAVGLLPAAILGLFWYMSATATPLHPDPGHVPSARHSAPLPKWADAVDEGRQLVRASLTEQNLPAVSVAIGIGGDIVWAEGFGWADLENRVPVTPDTRFRIGTASKALTSAAVGLLLEEGRLKLDDVIQTYVPAFPEKEWPVTLRQLMGHLAGVRNDAGDEEPLSVHCERTVEGLQRFAERPLLFEPGTHYRYSNYGWILVSAAVEAAAAEPFSTFMRKQIFEPLSMDKTTADSATGSSPNQATYYFPRFAADPRYGPQPPDDVDFSCFAGASAIVSTPSDLVRFVMAINTGKLLEPATVQLLQASQRLASGEDTGYGLGWDLETVAVAGEQTRVVGYDGELRDGMVASFMTFSERGIVVAVTSNISFADTSSIALKIAQVFAEQARSPAPK
jgi:serine beta-lactamase-like protein LACTB